PLPLDTLDLFGLHSLDRSLAGRVVPARVERGPAHRVTQRLGVARDARPPVGKEAQRTGELLALGSQLIGEADRPLAVRLGADDALRLQALQPVREDVRRDATDAGLQLIEAARPFQQRLDHEQAPSVPHPLEGSRERRFEFWHGRIVRHRSETPCIRWLMLVTCRLLVTRKSHDSWRLDRWGPLMSSGRRSPRSRKA